MMLRKLSAVLSLALSLVAVPAEAATKSCVESTRIYDGTAGQSYVLHTLACDDGSEAQMVTRAPAEEAVWAYVRGLLLGEITIEETAEPQKSNGTTPAPARHWYDGGSWR